MAARYPPAPPAEDPWKKRFEAEAKKHTRFPFPPGRKGKPMTKLPKKPRGY